MIEYDHVFGCCVILGGVERFHVHFAACPDVH